MSNVFALRDCLAALAGDVGAHASVVGSELGRAVLLCAQHGNKNPLDAAHEFMSTLKGASKAVKAVKHGYVAGIAAAGFLVVTEKTLADVRGKGDKRMPAPEAVSLAETVTEAFILGFGTMFNAPGKARTEKPAIKKVDVEAIKAERDAWKGKAQRAMAEVSALKAQLSAIQSTETARAVWVAAEPIEA